MKSTQKVRSSEVRTSDKLKEGYCPICMRVIEPCNKEEVERGKETGFVFVHDDVVHHDDDLVALMYGIN